MTKSPIFKSDFKQRCKILIYILLSTYHLITDEKMTRCSWENKNLV